MGLQKNQNDLVTTHTHTHTHIICDRFRSFMLNFKIVKYEQDNISIDVRYDIENKTIWLTQSEIALVFETTKNNITILLKSIMEILIIYSFIA